MSKQIDHNCTSNIICPHCGDEDHQSDELLAVAPNNTGIEECVACGKKFRWFAEITVNYSTEKITMSDKCQKCGSECEYEGDLITLYKCLTSVMEHPIRIHQTEGCLEKERDKLKAELSGKTGELAALKGICKTICDSAVVDETVDENPFGGVVAVSEELVKKLRGML